MNYSETLITKAMVCITYFVLFLLFSVGSLWLKTASWCTTLSQSEGSSRRDGALTTSLKVWCRSVTVPYNPAASQTIRTWYPSSMSLAWYVGGASHTVSLAALTQHLAVLDSLCNCDRGSLMAERLRELFQMGQSSLKWVKGCCRSCWE